MALEILTEYTVMSNVTRSRKDTVISVLNASGLAIVIALVPAAVLNKVLSSLWGDVYLVKQFCNALLYMQSSAAFLIGIMVALALGHAPMTTLMVGVATFIGSGVVNFVPYEVVGTDGATVTNMVMELKGVGDLVNAIIVASITSWILARVKNSFGSLTIILLPIIGGAFFGFAGKLLLPYTGYITTGLANIIQYFTTLSPTIMSMLIGASFAVIIVSPISSVVVAIAISASGIISGAASLGCSATMVLFLVASLRVNSAGVTIACLFGAVKMFVGNLFKYPILVLPMALTGAITGLCASLFTIQGTAGTAGFGFAGLIGPIAAYEHYTAMPEVTDPWFRIVLSYAVVPLIAALVVNFVCVNLLKLYKYDIYVFDAFAGNK